MIVQRVTEYIERERLFDRKARILVALSGGADSVALLSLLQQGGYACEAAHCNFRLRGEESDRDEAFVRHLCRERGVPLHVTRFDTARWAEERHVSIEMAARELRYGWFEELRRTLPADVIAVAHHKDDSAETFLLNLIRGTGIRGLQGIRPRNGFVVRPLLCVGREEILEYLDSIGQAYVTDSTNLQDEFTRNKIRLQLMPLMRQINPSVRESILQTAAHLSEASLIYQKGIDEGTRRVSTPSGIHIGRLLEEPAPQTLLYEMLSPKGFNTQQVQDLFQTLDGQPGKCIRAGRWCALKDREEILLEEEYGEEERKPHLSMEERPMTDGFEIPRRRDVACLDADKLKHPLSMRLWRQGDVFVPFGMKGRKRVSDYLTDRKFPLLRKARQWVLCSGEDIVWLVNERPDNRFRIDGNTRRVLIVRCCTEEESVAESSTSFNSNGN